MDELYRVMQTTETGEEFCAANDLTLTDGEEWIDDNAHMYPESRFCLELQVDCTDDDELPDLDFD